MKHFVGFCLSTIVGAVLGCASAPPHPEQKLPHERAPVAAVEPPAPDASSRATLDAGIEAATDGSEAVLFDVAACGELLREVGAGYVCDGNDCRGPIQAATAWVRTCYDPAREIPVFEAAKLAHLLLGASTDVPPMRLDARVDALGTGSIPLPFSDRRGFVVRVCGERPRTLEGYIKARQGCTNGEVVAVRLFGQSVLRAVPVPHVSDATFARWFPYFDVAGEQEARAMTRFEAFSHDVRRASDAAQGKRPEDAIPILMAALLTDISVVQWEPYQKVMKAVDRTMIPAFKAWGKRKVSGYATARSAEAQGLYSLRALQCPLSDMERDGTVRAGAYVAPPWFELDRWMPLSFIAYKEELSSLQRVANGYRGSSLKTEMLHAEMGLCAQAEQRVEAMQREVLACLSRDGCSKEQIESLSLSADEHRDTARRARENAARVLGSGAFQRVDMARIGKSLLEGGCGTDRPK